jgi:hypothetical protein
VINLGGKYFDFVVEEHEGVSVLREDLIDGGSKMRFLPALIGEARHIVFGGPFCGHAPLALAIFGQRCQREITLFYAKRAVLHPKQAAALAHGARIEWVAPGYMSQVQAAARAYAREREALFLPLGFDLPAAEAPYQRFMARVRDAVGDPAEIWCATGSGMLARHLGRAFPRSAIHAIAVGLASRHDAQDYPGNVRLLASPYAFARVARSAPPFPACPHYEAKAWEALRAAKREEGAALFWNVAGPL